MFWGIAYVIGYLVFWRNHVSFFREQFDGDMTWGLMFGSMYSLFWPGTVPIVLLTRCFVYYDIAGKVNSWNGGRFIPEQKPLETKAQREDRVEKEKAEEIATQRRAINDRERELDLPLTSWN